MRAEKFIVEPLIGSIKIAGRYLILWEFKDGTRLAFNWYYGLWLLGILLILYLIWTFIGWLKSKKKFYEHKMRRHKLQKYRLSDRLSDKDNKTKKNIYKEKE